MFIHYTSFECSENICNNFQDLKWIQIRFIWRLFASELKLENFDFRYRNSAYFIIFYPIPGNKFIWMNIAGVDTNQIEMNRQVYVCVCGGGGEK